EDGIRDFHVTGVQTCALPIWREAFRREGEFEEIGIGVGSDPALISELKVSAADIGKKSGEFERADFEFDAGAAPLFLECGAEDASALIGGTFQSQVQAHAALLAWQTGGFQKLFCARRIIRVLRHVGLEGPMVGRKDAGSDFRFAVKEIADERFAVGGESQRLADFAARKKGVLEIEAQ